MKLFQEIHCFIFRVALWLLMALNKKKRKNKETERQALVFAGGTWLTAAEGGLDVTEAVNWHKTRSQVQSSAPTAMVLIYRGVP